MRNILIILFALIGLDAMAYGPWIFGNNNISVQVPFTQKASIGTDQASTIPMLTIAGQRGVTAPISGTNLHVSGADGVLNRVQLDSFGATTGLSFRRSNGTQAAPSAATGASALGFIDFYGYGATAYSSTGRSSIITAPTETWTDSAQGTDFRLGTTLTGTTTTATRLRLDGAGSVQIGNNVADANASSIVDITSTTKGFLPPRQTTAQKTAIASPAQALEVYDTTLNQKQVYNGFSWDAGSVNIGYPVIKPTLLLDFANSKVLDSRITFTRATTATRVNERGLIESVASGIPRFDHDPTTQESLGLLIEESRVNTILRSEEFDNASWTKTRSTIVANTTVAPDGLTTAEKLVEDTSASNNHIAFQGNSFTSGTVYTASVFVKDAGNNRGIDLILASGAFPSAARVRMLPDFTVSAGAGATSVGIKAYQNGWYRIWVTATANATASTNVSLELVSGGTSVYTGDGTSGLFIWGAQLEVGAFPTSYIPTVASSVTRNADQASMTGTNFSSWFRSDEGTFVSKQLVNNSLNLGSVFPIIYSANDGTADNRIEGYIGANSAPNTSRFFVRTLASDQANITTTGNITAGTSYRYAGTYKVNAINAVKDGGTVINDPTATIPSVNQLNLGTRPSSSTSFLNGTIAQLYFYPKQLTNAELQAVTR